MNLNTFRANIPIYFYDEYRNRLEHGKWVTLSLLYKGFVLSFFEFKLTKVKGQKLHKIKKKKTHAWLASGLKPLKSR